MHWRSLTHACLPFYADLARNPRILDVVEDLIGPDILVWTSTFFIKEALVADLRRLAPGTRPTSAWSPRAGDGLGGADRRQPGCRLHGGAVGARQAAPDASRSEEARHSINRTGQTITEPLDEVGRARDAA